MEASVLSDEDDVSIVEPKVRVALKIGERERRQ